MGVVSLSLSACGDGVFGFCLLFLGLLSELRPLESEHESCRLSLWGLPAWWLRAGLSERDVCLPGKQSRAWLPGIPGLLKSSEAREPLGSLAMFPGFWGFLP